MIKETDEPNQKDKEYYSNEIPFSSILASDAVTVRDYFAAKAMKTNESMYSNMDIDDVAKYAYKLADAMLKERNK